MKAFKISVASSLIFSNWRAFGQQPRVTTLESQPAKRSGGIISLPKGSPWCLGQPTIFIPGHQNTVFDEPNCFWEGRWQKPGIAKLDIIDELNAQDGPLFILDRHECGVLDINNDGILDIYCLMGADRGTGMGFNEVYLTQQDGTLKKVRRHALQRFAGARTRRTTTLNSVNGTKLVFISASYGPRPDGQINQHAMFRTTGVFNSDYRKSYFEHFEGAWQTHTNASCAIAADINRDGLDDLILCNEHIGATMVVQKESGKKFFNSPLPMDEAPQRNWRNARVGDFDGDGLLDIAVVYHSEHDSFLRVFKGIEKKPYFDFRVDSWFSRHLPFAAPDLEAFDANGDGILDIYVVQANERHTENNYCGGPFIPNMWWTNGMSLVLPPTDFVPPPDATPDILFIGQRGSVSHKRFREVKMEHSEPGCGYFVKKFGERSLVLAQGGFVRPGHQLLLEW